MSEYKTLSDFKEYELFPALFGVIDRAFPQLAFKSVSGRWESRIHIDGDPDRQNKSVTFVYANRKFTAVDHARGNKGLIDLYMSLNNTDFPTALKELSTLCNLTPPNSSPEDWGAYEEEQTNREIANETFKEALFSDTKEANKVRAYLYSRGWADSEIKKMGLGLITTEIRNSLPDGASYKGVVKNSEGRAIWGVGTTHLLTIPYRNGSRLLGFKFREVEEASTGTKYLNSVGLHKSSGLFGIGVGVDDIVIVEGELDSLHAQALGADNVVATAGNNATESQIRDAVKRGVKKFTLLFDNDESGRSFIRPTIEAIQKVGGDIYVASLPDGIKDLDEYLTAYTLQEYKEKVVGEAVSYSTFILSDIVGRYKEKQASAGSLSPKDRDGFFMEIERLISSPYTKPYNRAQIYTDLARYEEDLNFKVSDIKDSLENAYHRAQEKSRAEEVRGYAKKILEATESGNTTEALRLMKEASAKQGSEEKALEYAQLFAPSTPEDYAKFLSESKAGVPTGFIFSQGKQSVELTLNAGLTFICAYRGHGKTSFLNNIALNEAKRNIAQKTGKSVLYFSYEIDKRRLMTDLLNTFVNDADLSKKPLDSILSYFKGYEDKYFSKEKRADGLTHYENFVKQKDVFFRDYLSSGALTLVDENFKVEKLLEAMKYYISHREVSIVCIDYAQLIYSEDYSRQRTEEIKKVVNELKDFANAERIPIVLACQFNREVDSPIDVETQNIGEGGDFERIADTCIGLFNLKELREPKDGRKKNLKDLMLGLNVLALEPQHDKIFARLMKRRYDFYPIDTILEWEGRTKYIKPNYAEALERKDGEFFIPDLDGVDLTGEGYEEDFL
ncbi:MAG: toprim domain-containing protein [Ruminiclostridium sp.]|nr:toprim domain-containing protein [Ruminiclostridium sp.]